MSQPPTPPTVPASASSPSSPPQAATSTASSKSVRTPAASPTAAQVNSIEKASADALEATKAAAHSAKMAMIAAIVSGVLAIGGTIIGGVVAGQSASSTLDQQLFGETERSRAEFLRNQREELYSAIVEHELALEELEDDLFQAVQFDPKDSTDDPRDMEKVVKRTLAARDQLTNKDGAKIIFVGSTAARKSFEALTDQHAEIIDKTIQFGSMWTPNGSAEMENVAEEVDALGEGLPKLREQFYNACRDDMGAN